MNAAPGACDQHSEWGRATRGDGRRDGTRAPPGMPNPSPFTIVQLCSRFLPDTLLRIPRHGELPASLLRCRPSPTGSADAWALLLALQYRATKKITGAHGDSIWSVAWAGSSRLVTGSLDEVVKTWCVHPSVCLCARAYDRVPCSTACAISCQRCIARVQRCSGNRVDP
jgi:hypothetical protein